MRIETKEPEDQPVPESWPITCAKHPETAMKFNKQMPFGRQLFCPKCIEGRE